MNKFGLVLGVAAVAAIAGCKDPAYYSKHNKNVQNEPQPVETQPANVEPTPVTPVDTPDKGPEITTTEQHCKCPAGTVHKEKCGCGAPDCKCAVELPPPPPAVEETTPYIVQRGDYLAKISKKFNLTIASIKRVNPNMKGDIVRVGQTIKLPGKVSVGEQKVPVVAPAVKAPAKEYKPYTGATKDYVVQRGDSLGLIAKKNGVSVRQLKELNGLSSDVVRIGKTLKVPADKAAAVAPAPAKTGEKKTPAPKADKSAAEGKTPVTPAVTPVVTDTATTEPPKVDEKHCTCPAGTVHTEPCPCNAPDCKCTVTPAVETKAPANEGTTHVVSEGEDITSLSILYSLSPTEIRSFNNLGETDELKVGQIIKIPGEQQ